MRCGTGSRGAPCARSRLYPGPVLHESSGAADAVRDDYDAKPSLSSHRNNHLYWAAWSVGLVSAALDDRALLAWSLAKARVGIAQITNEGFLPLELERKGRALHYHVFAAAPVGVGCGAGGREQRRSIRRTKRSFASTGGFDDCRYRRSGTIRPRCRRSPGNRRAYQRRQPRLARGIRCAVSRSLRSEGGCRLSGSAAARVQSLVRRRCDASVSGGKTPINADSITRTPASP
jgi:hypothetical protein